MEHQVILKIILTAVGLLTTDVHGTVDSMNKKWSYKDRIKWYYNRYPEKWADKLGGVRR